MVIWKFEIKPDATISMPVGAEILSVAVQNNQPCVWAMVDPDAPRENRSFKTVPTGADFDTRSLKYVGSFHDEEGWMVFHLFEEFGF
jgi:hypothetical protein